MDKLSVHGIELWLKIGCTKEERAFAQKVFLDVHMEMPLGPVGISNDISKSVDYAAVVGEIKKNLVGKNYRLLEAVAEKTAALILKHKRVEGVTVRVEKFALPGILSASVMIKRP